MKTQMIATMYGTKLMAYNETTGRVILATVNDHTEAFANWTIKTIEQDKIADAAMIARLKAAAAKQGSKIVNV